MFFFLSIFQCLSVGIEKRKWSICTIFFWAKEEHLDSYINAMLVANCLEFEFLVTLSIKCDWNYYTKNSKSRYIHINNVDITKMYCWLPMCRGGQYSFPWIVLLTLSSYLIMLRAKQGGIKHHVLETLVWLDQELNPGLLVNTLHNLANNVYPIYQPLRSGRI